MKPAPLSRRRVRARVVGNTNATVTLARGFSAFLNLTFWGRMAWLFFGARVFAPKDAEPRLVEIVGDEPA